MYLTPSTRVARLATVAGVLFSAGCEPSSHNVHTIVECPSATGRHLATFYVISGGGAAGFQYEYVSVRPAHSPFQPLEYALQLKGGYDARLIWRGDTALLVEYPQDARVDSAATFVRLADSVALDYVARPAEGGQFAQAGSGCTSLPLPDSSEGP